MTPVPPLPAALAALVLFCAPGLLFLAHLPARERDDLSPPEALFLLVGVSTAASAWLALLLAELGRFHLLTAAATLAVACGALALLWRRRLAWPLRLPPPGDVRLRAALRAWAPALAVLALAFTLDARPSEYLFGGRDPGTYVNAMALIGRTGGIVYTDPAVLAVPREHVSLFYREPDKPGTFEWGRFMGFPLERPETGRVVPEFFHVFPAFGAYLFQSMGVKGALATPPIFGVLGTLAVFFAFRLLLGPGTALAAALLLGVNVLQVWFARFPVSETFSQFLTFLALGAFLRWEQRGAGAWGTLAGAALGLSLLVRIDSVLVVAPLLAFVLIRLAEGALPRRRLLALLLPFALLAGHAGIHALFFARKYVTSILTRPYWRQPAWVWALAALGLVAAVFLARRFGPAVVAWLEDRRGALQAAVGLGLVALSLYAYFARPWLSRLAGADGNPATLRLDVEPPETGLLVDGRLAGTVAELEARGGLRLAGDEYDLRLELPGHVSWRAQAHVANGRELRVRHVMQPGTGEQAAAALDNRPQGSLLARLGFRRLAAHDAQALVRFGWFVTPLGLVLALCGLLLVLREWRPAWLFPLLLALTFAVFYFYKMRVWNDYYFAMRRVVPVTLPFAVGLAALALGRLAARGRWRRVVAAALGAGLAWAFVQDLRPIVRHVDWGGAVRFTADLARRFGPEDVVVFEQPRSIHLLALPLWAVHGLNVLELARFNPDPERLNDVVRAWRGRYRQVYFVHTYSTDLCGVFLQRVQDLQFGAHEFERPDDRRPRRPEYRALRFTVSRVVPPEELSVPALPHVDIGGSDDFQVSGFFDKEVAAPVDGPARSFRWTGRCASVYLPAARPGATLTVTASGDKRPAERPARVELRLNGVPLGSFVAGTPWQDFRFRLPAPLPPGPPVLRFDTSTWRPAGTLPGSDDVRDLGVAVDGIGVGDGPAVVPGAGGA